MAYAYSASKLWPSQRGEFLNEIESRSSYIMSPPLGMSASRLQYQIEYNRSRSRSRSRRPNSKSRPGTNLSQLITNSHQGQSHYPWTRNEVRSGFQRTTSAIEDEEYVSNAPELTVQGVSTKRFPFKSLGDLRLPKSQEDLLVPEISWKAANHPSSTEDERDLVTRLCAQAMQKRRRAYDYYWSLNNKLNLDSQTRLRDYDPSVYKVPLCDLMLQLVAERETMLNRRAEQKRKDAGLVKIRKRVQTAQQELPVYCLEGTTILGKASDIGIFRNTFAHISSLKKPEDDPPGFERYSAVVDMSGFHADEILMHAFGDSFLRIDGCGCIEVPEAGGPRPRRVTEDVKLPEGVYPDRLLIGRSQEGILVIQEPWKF